jgi:hypothetical protein
MEESRRKQLDSREGGVLTEQEWNEGWHFCPDWDDMLVCNKGEVTEECACSLGVHPPRKFVEKVRREGQERRDA